MAMAMAMTDDNVGKAMGINDSGSGNDNQTIAVGLISNTHFVSKSKAK
jgi:hypothetical protein